MSSHQLLLLLAFAPLACAGPPFQTDDPDPVPFGHYEFYTFGSSNGTTAGGTDLLVPAVEFNWGAVPNLQIHGVLPMDANFAPNHGPVNYGLTDTELGVKYRFIKESKYRPEVGTFPFIELPTGNASRALGVGSTWYRVPVWVQKSWGDWTSYGGVGRVLTTEPGYKSYTFAGGLLQRKFNKRWTLGAEVFGHGEQGIASTVPGSATMLDIGGYYYITPNFEVLFCGGRSVAGQAETYSYLGLYWTWGSDKQKSGSAHFFHPGTAEGRS